MANTDRRELTTGSATYGDPHFCQYCSSRERPKRAEVFDVDGSWCSPECQGYDRGAEVTWWRKAVAR